MNEEIATSEVTDAAPEGQVCGVSPAFARLQKSITALQSLLVSGELEADLRRMTLANPFRHGDRTLSSYEASVVGMLGSQPRPQPLNRFPPKQLATFPRLEHAGFLVRRGAMVEITPRGRAFAAVYRRRRDVSKVEASQWRAWAEDLSRRFC